MECPRCNCADSRVYRTVKLTNKKIRRHRTCRYCQKNFSTTEQTNPLREYKKTKRKFDEEEDVVLLDEDDDC